MPNLWDHNQGIPEGRKESPEAYRCFRVWLELGKERSQQVAVDVAGSTIGKIKSWSSRHNWNDRAAAYDAHQVSEWSKQVRDDFESTHKSELLKFRRDQQKRAAGLGRVADLLIEVTTTTLEEMASAGEAVDTQQLAAVARTAAALTESSMNTAAAALGVDDLIEAINPEEE